MHDLPSGTVTFLFTDIEGSTRLWEERPNQMRTALARHDEIASFTISEFAGILVKSRGEGDSLFAVFRLASDAVAAASALQSAYTREPWSDSLSLRVRMALHTGEAALRDGDYYGSAVNRCARLRAIGHGGQVLLSAVTHDLCRDSLPPDCSLKPLGEHRLKDLDRSETVYQLCHPGRPAEFPPLRSLDNPELKHNLPLQRTSFVGREDEIRIIRSHLHENRLVTLMGVGGCGKTRLALQVAVEEIEAFTDGVFFTELATVSDPNVIASAAAGAMSALLGGGLGMAPGHTVRDDLVDALARREVLVVLDNCEHLIEACSELADDLLGRCPEVRILATSREALGVPGEQTHTVRSLQLPAGDDIAASESVRLFCDRARSMRADFKLTPDNAADIGEICMRLDGVPLAIELAAARVTHLSPRQIAQRLDDRFALLTGGRRRVQRQQTLAAVLDWSHDLLTDDERALLRRLAVFSGSFTLSAAEAICGERVMGLLASLVNKSMVVIEEGHVVRYRLLETVRMYAEEKLVAAGEADKMRSRHRDHFLSWVESFPDDDGMRPDSPGSEEQANLRAALAWSEHEGRADLIGRLASLMCPLWDSIDVHEGARWLATGAEAAGELDKDSAVRVLTARAFIGLVGLEPIDHEAILRRALDLAGDSPGFWPSYASGLLSFFRGLAAPGGANTAEEIEELGRRAERLATGPAARFFALTWFGNGLICVGNVDRAIAVFERALTDPGVARYDIWLPFDATLLSILYHLTGEHGRALEWAETYRGYVFPPHMRCWELYCSLSYPLALAAGGRHEEAMFSMRERIKANGDWFMPGSLAASVVVLGAMAALRGEFRDAAVLIGCGGAALARGDSRTPADGALCEHYVRIVDAAHGTELRSLRDQGAAMSLEAALAYGLAPRPKAGADAGNALPI